MKAMDNAALSAAAWRASGKWIGVIVGKGLPDIDDAHDFSIWSVVHDASVHGELTDSIVENAMDFEP